MLTNIFYCTFFVKSLENREKKVVFPDFKRTNNKGDSSLHFKDFSFHKEQLVSL